MSDFSKSASAIVKVPSELPSAFTNSTSYAGGLDSKTISTVPLLPGGNAGDFTPCLRITTSYRFSMSSVSGYRSHQFWYSVWANYPNSLYRDCTSVGSDHVNSLLKLRSISSHLGLNRGFGIELDLIGKRAAIFARKAKSFLKPSCFGLAYRMFGIEQIAIQLVSYTCVTGRSLW